MSFTWSRILVVVGVAFAFGGPGSVRAADPAPADPSPAKAETKVDANQEAGFKKFQETLSGSKLVGRFTILGKEDPPAKEEYTIKSVTKLPQGDYWAFETRIKYGNKDVTVPLPLEVKWAGDTPIITLTNLTIPGLGTFDARVVIHGKSYAGTWTHGAVGGHLFGTIEKLP